MVSTFTATLTTILTVSRLESSIQGPGDLYRMNVATVDRSTSMDYLLRRGIAHRAYKDVPEGMRAVVRKEIDAMVYDAPLLEYLAHHKFNGALTVLPALFQQQDYGIAMPAHSPLRKPINQTLLKILQSDAWMRIKRRYLGK